MGSLVLAAPLVLWRLATTDAFRHDEGVIVPLVVVPVMFLFVLMVILLTKAPKVGAGLIVALVAMGVLGLFFVRTLHVSHAPRAEVSLQAGPARATVRQAWTGDSATSEAIVQEFDPVSEHYGHQPPAFPSMPCHAANAANAGYAVTHLGGRR